MRTLEPIAKFDFVLSSFCLRHRFNQQFASISKAISHTGDGHLYVMMAVLASLLDKAHGPLFFATALLAFAIELPSYVLIKKVFKRRRPGQLSSLLPAFITPADQYSLPSGHTAAAFVMATVMGHFYPELFVFSVIWAACIGVSRILLGVHFFSDILFGVGLGVACGLLSIAVLG
ncbi:phosphatase PAP2 family protein [Vibrio sp. S4M6]|uniref:phosphatase PAP2 family protein n=1 Tax=Vibrio sinus TaxID=2946865 RepID=UPI00202AAA3F|nr:phosphatase PAP2 family protein [Vibrio sinus]MCL9781572.1 phosphatase PAP2 family protein [Vibrio sinus]